MLAVYHELVIPSPAPPPPHAQFLPYWPPLAIRLGVSLSHLALLAPPRRLVEHRVPAVLTHPLDLAHQIGELHRARLRRGAPRRLARLQGRLG